MGAGTVPVSLHGFGVEGDDNAEIFGHSMEDVSGYPQLVTDRDAFAGSYLVFPLKQFKFISSV